VTQRRAERATRFVGITSLCERLVEVRLQLFVDLVVELFAAK
jgi:hypothetical protein